MESFSIFKYWRGGARPQAGNNTLNAESAAVTESRTAPTESDGEATDDEGPFFDLDFAVDSSTQEGGEGRYEENERMEDSEEVKDFNFSITLSEGDESQSLSDSGDIFFKETSSIVIADEESDPKAQLAYSLLKSVTKLRVFILGLRKFKSTTEANATATIATVVPRKTQQASKFFFVNFKVEEVPIVSLFTRESSSQKSTCGGNADNGAAVAPEESEEKKQHLNSKDVVQKYFRKIKPKYIRISKRYSDKLRLSGHLIPGGFPASELSSVEEKGVEAEKPTKIKMPEKLRFVYPRLGKKESSSSAVATAPPPPPHRRDGSLLDQQDGIQSAIAHCKLSLTAASKGAEQSIESFGLSH